jgi:hypothetical protein
MLIQTTYKENMVMSFNVMDSRSSLVRSNLSFNQAKKMSEGNKQYIAVKSPSLVYSKVCDLPYVIISNELGKQVRNEVVPRLDDLDFQQVADILPDNVWSHVAFKHCPVELTWELGTLIVVPVYAKHYFNKGFVKLQSCIDGVYDLAEKVKNIDDFIDSIGSGFLSSTFYINTIKHPESDKYAVPYKSDLGLCVFTPYFLDIKGEVAKNLLYKLKQ